MRFMRGHFRSAGTGQLRRGDARATQFFSSTAQEIAQKASRKDRFGLALEFIGFRQ
jgi:hypothetical protein